MELGDFTSLLDRYGSSLEDWPEQEAESARRLLERDTAASAARARQRELETLIGDLPTPRFPGLEARIAAQALPPRGLTPLDRLLGFLLPEADGRALWRPAIAACLPLVMGIVLGNYLSFGIVAEEQISQEWDDELMMLSLVIPDEVVSQP